MSDNDTRLAPSRTWAIVLNTINTDFQANKDVLILYGRFDMFHFALHFPFQGWVGKAFWLPGTGREIENHIPVLREKNGN